MEVIELALLMALQGFLCICSFIIGAKVGQNVVQGEKVELGIKSPVKAYEEHREKQEQIREEERLQTIAENIDNYDGTGLGQKDIPQK